MSFSEKDSAVEEIRQLLHSFYSNDSVDETPLKECLLEIDGLIVEFAGHFQEVHTAWKLLGRETCNWLKMNKKRKFDMHHLISGLRKRFESFNKKKHGKGCIREQSALKEKDETKSESSPPMEKSKATSKGSDTKAPVERLKGIVVAVTKVVFIVAPLSETGGRTDRRVSIKKDQLSVPGISVHVGDEMSYKPSGIKDTWGFAPEFVRKKLNSEEMITYLNALDWIGMERPLEMLTKIQSCRPPWDHMCSLPSLPSIIISSMLKIINYLAVAADKISLRSSGRLASFFEDLASSHFSTVTLQQFVQRAIRSFCSEEAVALRGYLQAVAKTAPTKFMSLFPVFKKLAILAHSQDIRRLPAEESESWQSMMMAFKVMKSLIFGLSGAGDDVEGLEWNELPLVPTRGELLGRAVAAETLPKVKVGEPYESEDEYLDAYFRLLRGDCFYELSTGIKSYLSRTLDKRDMALYRASLDGAQITSSGMAISLRFEVLGKKGVDWRYSSLLMFGNLLCLSVGGDFKEPIWATVTHRSEELLKKGIVFISLISCYNSLTDADAVLQLQNAEPVSTPCDKAYTLIVMAESPTYYRAYGPVLQCLQSKSECVPFVDELVHLKRARASPAYLRRGQCDWSIVFGRLPSACDEDNSLWEIDLLDQLIPLSRTTLDQSQLQAIQTSFSNRIALIQGPPGTGKSFIGVKLVRLILSMTSKPSGPILVLTYKNHALDQFLEDCLPFCDDLVRIGGRSQNEQLTEKNLTHLRNKRLGRQDKNRRLGELRFRLKDLKGAFFDAARELRNCRTFNLETFLQKANWKQVLSLLEYCPRAVNPKKIGEMSKEVKGIHEIPVGRDLLRGKYKTKFSEVLRKWCPSSNELNECTGKVSTSNNSALVKAYASEKEKKGSAAAESQDNQDDIDEIEQERFLTFDYESGLKKGQWRDKDQGFIFMDSPKSSAFEFSVTVPIIPSGYDLSTAQMDCTNLWNLTKDERAELILYWVLNGQEEASSDFVKIMRKQEELLEEIRELEAMADAAVIQEASIVGMTTTGAAIHALLINKIAPAVIIVEEAAEILESQLLAVLPGNAKHLIMIGDHKQLRPQVQSYDLKRKNKFDVSMFERLLEGGLPFAQLEHQCRMRDEFVDLIRPIYPNLKTNQKLVAGNKIPCGISKSMYFYTHTERESSSEHSRSLRNVGEAGVVMNVLKWLIRESHNPEKITILTTYRGQLQELRKMVRALKVEGVKTSTVDRYQGDENDILLISLVRSNHYDRIGFLAASNRMCVAASRARCGNYFFGNAHLLASKSPFWRVLLSVMEMRDCVGSDFPIVCPRHPGKTIKLGAESTCREVCMSALLCGHRCQAFCHSTGIHPRCKQIVSFTFKNCGHTVEKGCSEPETNIYCRKPVQDRHIKCGHRFERFCFQSNWQVPCKLPCVQILPCWHPCPLTCSDDCSTATCATCLEKLRLDLEKEKEAQRLKAFALKKEAAEELARIRKRSLSQPQLISKEWTHENGELYSEIQYQMNRCLPKKAGMEVKVRKVFEFVNPKALESWLEAKTKMAMSSDSTYRFVLCHSENIKDAIKHGLKALPKECLSSQWDMSKALDPKSVALRFKIARGTLIRCESVEKALSMLRESERTENPRWDSLAVPIEQEKQILLLRDNNLGLLDHVVNFTVSRVDKEKAANITELGMSLEAGFFEIQSLKWSRNVGENRMEQLLYREAEAQFLRMLGSNIGRYKVTQVDYINNGNLNKAFKETKARFSREQKPTEEVFAFHGTSEEAIKAIARDGFKIGGKSVTVAHGSVYGIGVYTAEDPSTAMHYSRGNGKVLLSRILPGKNDVDFNYGATSLILVLKNEGQIVPQYIVHFEELNELHV